ncbi:MAG: sucrose synthase [Thermosynechococcaceae cyanobacterium MS004]|nr:sucrose synthase [Thermosynechococcaceae cyanobacterium MS004]
MLEVLQAVLRSDEKGDLRQLVADLHATEKRYLLRNEILQTFEHTCQVLNKAPYFFYSSRLGELIHLTHEVLLEEGNVWLILRPRIARQLILRLSADLGSVDVMPPETLLDLRDRLVDRYQPGVLEIDLQPFYDLDLSIQDPRSIGEGLGFLHRYLAGNLGKDPQTWMQSIFEVLRSHHFNGLSLLLNERIHSAEHLQQQVKEATGLLHHRLPQAGYETVHLDLQTLGFDPGWGDTVARACETFELLDRLLHTPDSAVLEALVSRIPSIFKIVLISIHGWVGQDGVLGRPETAGQVAYVMDQARHLEHALTQNIQRCGLDRLGVTPHIVILTRLIPDCDGTQCALPLEQLKGTEHAWILRVPFRNDPASILPQWISKFEVWPYLEGFANEAEKAVLAHLQGKPDLIIGNYTDGNLVSFLLARRLKAPHCFIAHALEKPKYLFSDLYWQDLEPDYHFSLLFTADLIGMNAADFIVTSSAQEILGTPDTTGQFESYQCFSLPQLYHVVNGIDLRSPKFNVVPPGVNERAFFPYHLSHERSPSDRDRIADLLFHREDSQILGYFETQEKRTILSFAPIIAVKNLPGLVECFGRSTDLRDRCNLVVLTGKLHPEEAINAEEKGEIEALHHLIEEYQLEGSIRWIGTPLSSLDLGEAFRVVADRQGIFLHTARFEPFGLTILESMISGLPTFASQFGGPSEIIEHGVNGYLINPTNLEETASKILQFFQDCNTQPDHWKLFSERSIHRVKDRYSWTIHTTKLLALANLYWFWNKTAPHNREAMFRYLELIYHFIYKSRASALLQQTQDAAASQP